MDSIMLSAPWVNYYHELEAFFQEDPDVKVTYNHENVEICLYVEGAAKADALDQLLEHEIKFGETILTIKVIPANVQLSRASLVKNALEGNKAFSYLETIQGPMSNPMTFVVFKNAVVQYFTDNLGDIHGVRSTLYQDMAKELFGENEGVYFCTDLPEE